MLIFITRTIYEQYSNMNVGFFFALQMLVEKVMLKFLE